MLATSAGRRPSPAASNAGNEISDVIPPAVPTTPAREPAAMRKTMWVPDSPEWPATEIAWIAKAADRGGGGSTAMGADAGIVFLGAHGYRDRPSERTLDDVSDARDRRAGCRRCTGLVAPRL